MISRGCKTNDDANPCLVYCLGKARYAHTFVKPDPLIFNFKKLSSPLAESQLKAPNPHIVA